MDKINEIRKRSKLNNILSYLIYGSDSIRSFSENYDKTIQELYDIILNSLEQMYADADRNDKHLCSAIKTFAQIHEDIYFEVGLKVGIRLSKEWELESSLPIQDNLQRLDSESILSSIAELRMETTLEEELRRDTEYQ